MYTILVTQDDDLITSIKERVMQRSKLVNTLHFLVDPLYRGLDASKFTVRMEYFTPNSKEFHSELLKLSKELYKDKLEYKLSIDTELTKEAGNIEIQLAFTMLEMDIEGNVTQRVRRTTPTIMTVTPLSSWSNFSVDNSLNALDSAFLQLEGYMKRIEENIEQINSK